MADSDSVTWRLERHTLAKHEILTRYLKAWVPILARARHQENAFLRYVDGFAGPGIYSEKEDGSPILAIKTILEEQSKLRVPVRFFFVEKDPQRFANLNKLLGRLEDETDECVNIYSVKRELGDCGTVLSKQLDSVDRLGSELGPAFFFLDQFGYGDVPMDLIGRIMDHKRCEVFSYLNWTRMNQFLPDPAKSNAITAAFGSESWKGVLELAPKQKAAFMLETYKAALRELGNAKYVCHFNMLDEQDKLTHWMFFCTNNLKGLKEMKKAMRKVDESGYFRFSDKDDPEQAILFTGYGDEDLIKALSSNFAGQTVTVGEIEEFVPTQTPLVEFKSALKEMEKKDLISVVEPNPKRRFGTFPDLSMKIRFH